MITLPDSFKPAHATHQLLDFGFYQRGPLGGKTSRINRKGNRYQVSYSFGPYYPELARQLVNMLLAAKRQGIRLAYPLQFNQGQAGSPIVDGAGQQGTSLKLRGFLPNYICQNGYWFSIADSNGRNFLHRVEVGGIADASGKMTVKIDPELRQIFADGSALNFVKPVIEGWVIGDAFQWETNVNQATPINFTVEEAE